MEVAEAIARFERFNGKFEREAVETAVAHKQEVIPELLHVLEEIADPERAAQRNAEGDFMAQLYAMFLLAQFREARAYPLVVRIALLPGDLLDSLFGDFVTEGLGQVLASVCGGNLEGIQSIIENADADEWARGAALGALVTLVAAGIKTRDEILGYFADLFHGRLKDKNRIVWSDLVVHCADLAASDLLSDIERAYEAGLVDSGIVGIGEVRRDVARGEDWALGRLATNRHRQLIDDTVKEMQWWACFKEKTTSQKQTESPALAAANSIRANTVAPIKRTAPKVGRNDPCPCGSGKKFKKCCLQ
jgi:hypothetical protein